jgi:acetyltransferase-like isoleucine patch superfamily enzyme
MLAIFEYLISKFLNRNVNFDKSVPFDYLFFLCLNKLFSLIRGVVYIRKFAFIGRNVSILCKSKLHLGTSIQIHDSVVIDCLSRNGFHIGDYSKISSNSFLRVSGTISDLGDKIVIGSNVSIGEFSHIGGAGGFTIGDNTIIGSYFSVHPENHNFAHSDKLIRNTGVTRKGIQVGSNCWIGAKVTLLDGCSIGNNCVIAAGAVVNGNFASNLLIGGIPAKVIKHI